MRAAHIIAWALIASACTRVAGDEFDTPMAAETGSSAPSESAGSTGANASAGSPTTASDDAADEESGAGPSFDVGTDRCPDAGAGWTCDGAIAIECDAVGNEIGSDLCSPGVCVDGQGCVACVEGQASCMGAKVRVCDTTIDPPTWEVVEICDAAAGESCDVELVACAPAEIEGGTTPTGRYFQYASFGPTGDVFLGGFDVAGRGDRLYVHRTIDTVDVYRIELVDGDGDGAAEPNQHPDNLDDPGEIEPRILTLEQTIAIEGGFHPSASELHAVGDDIFVGGLALTRNPAGGGSQVLSDSPAWVGMFEQLGYDEPADVWYASNQSDRTVYQRDPADDTWGLAFRYPVLAGGHMDGLEVVADPNTSEVFIYVSDMTSDFLGQYRHDANLGWVQENLFEYAGATGVPVEGLGFGPLRHFWSTGEGRLYEIGGGDLATYTEPAG